MRAKENRITEEVDKNKMAAGRGEKKKPKHPSIHFGNMTQYLDWEKKKILLCPIYIQHQCFKEAGVMLELWCQA